MAVKQQRCALLIASRPFTPRESPNRSSSRRAPARATTYLDFVAHREAVALRGGLLEAAGLLRLLAGLFGPVAYVCFSSMSAKWVVSNDCAFSSGSTQNVVALSGMRSWPSRGHIAQRDQVWQPPSYAKRRYGQV